MDKFCLQRWKKQKFVDITLNFHNLNKDSKFQTNLFFGKKVDSLQFGAFTGIHGGLCNPKLMGHWNSWMSLGEKLLHAKYLRSYYLLTGHELGSWNFYYDGRMDKT